MAMRKLEKPEWQAYFDHVSETLGAKQAEVEVASLDIGDQIAAEWVPLLGLAYDPNNDVLEVALEGLDHLIHSPREIHVDETEEGLKSVALLDGEGKKQIIKLKAPLLLPARP